MDDLNPRAVIGGNTPPDPIDTITAAYNAAREEAENWLDGTAVENERQMHAVDTLREAMRKCRLALEAGQKSATAPLYDAYKTELARWKPTIEDTQRIEKGLVSIVGAFKAKLAAEKEAARKEAERLAWEATRAAQEAARNADAANIEATRAAAQAIADAEAAQAAAKVAAKDTVKGLRTVTRFAVTDRRALLNWIARNDRDAITAFIDEWAAKNHKPDPHADGLKVWVEKEAF